MANDEVPETLIPVLKILADDLVPETLAAADFIYRWLAERKPDPGAVAVGRLAEALGTADFIVRGETIKALAKPPEAKRGIAILQFSCWLSPPV